MGTQNFYPKAVSYIVSGVGQLAGVEAGKRTGRAEIAQIVDAYYKRHGLNPQQCDAVRYCTVGGDQRSVMAGERPTFWYCFDGKDWGGLVREARFYTENDKVYELDGNKGRPVLRSDGGHISFSQLTMCLLHPRFANYQLADGEPESELRRWIHTRPGAVQIVSMHIGDGG